MKKQTKNPNKHSRIINTLKRLPQSIWKTAVEQKIKQGGDAVWKVIQEMQQQNSDHPKQMKKMLGRGYNLLMQYKPSRKKVGKTKLRKLPGNQTEITAPDTMHTGSLQRLLSSKKYSSYGTEQREIIKEGEQPALFPVMFSGLNNYTDFWCIPPHKVNYYLCRKITKDHIKVIATGQIFDVDPTYTVLLIGKEFFSLTIKQTAGTSDVTNMATKTAPKKAAKKTTGKKASSKKPAVKKATDEKTLASKAADAGLISNIIFWHKEGLSNKDIIEKKGFNKSTVGIQVAKYKRGESNYK